MFTGIIEEKGTVKSLVHRKNLSLLKVAATKIPRGLKPGDSVAVDGACLTVVEKKNTTLTFDIMRETLEKTTLGRLEPDSLVNLERPLTVNGRLHGHFVTGHVDEKVIVKDRIKQKNYIELRLTLHKNIRPYLVPKGSVAIDGVSLTVGKIARDFFSVYLIPFTDRTTTLGKKIKGDLVNVETDVLAKYILNAKKG